MKNYWRILFILFFSLFYPEVNFAQNKNAAYLKIDERAVKVPTEVASNLDSLSHFLIKDCITTLEKVRSIYVWVATNVSYDVSLYENRRKLIDLLLKKRDASQSDVAVLKNRKAVCEGYAALLKTLCNKAGIKCEMVEGIGRAQKGLDDLHGWNAVLIGNVWQLLDVTWAAGGVDSRKKIFHKSFDDTFFLMPAKEFIKTHYPFDPMWQLLNHPIKKYQFDAFKYSVPDSTVFSFNDTIIFHYQQDSISQLISLCRRIVQYDPENNLAVQNLNSLYNYRENEKMNTANSFASKGVAQYNECVTITNDAKKNRSTKKMNVNEARLKQLVNYSRANLASAIELYKEINFLENANDFILKKNLENCLLNLNQLNDLQKYFETYFKTPKTMRATVL